MSQRKRPPRAPLKWSGILFAFAANVLLVNLAQILVTTMGWGVTWEALATLAAPLVVGIGTAFYVRQRGGMHAFLGGLASIAVLGMGIFDGNWQFAILAGAFCTLGGVAAELYLRSRSAASA